MLEHDKVRGSFHSRTRPREKLLKVITEHQSAKMKFSLFAFALNLIGPSQAALRFGCSTLSIQRLDPLVEPGNTPSAHVSNFYPV